MYNDKKELGLLPTLKKHASKNCFVYPSCNISNHRFRDVLFNIIRVTSFSTAMVSIAIILPSVNFSSTQQLSKLYSQEISFFIGFTSKIVLFGSNVSVGFSVVSLSLGNSALPF